MNWLKLFIKKTPEAAPTINLSAEQVRKAIPLLGNHEGPIEDEQVVELFVANDIEHAAAIELLLFLPIAFVRQLLPDLNWSNTYIETSKKKNTSRKYAETPAYVTIEQVTTEYFNNPDKNIVLKIAGRSAEFHALNQLLLDNPAADMKHIEISDTIIIR